MSNYALSTMVISVPWGLAEGERGVELTARVVFVILASELIYRVWRHFAGDAS